MTAISKVISIAAMLIVAVPGYAKESVASSEADARQAKTAAFAAFLEHSRAQSNEVMAALVAHAHDVVGLELITAGPLDDNVESRWGHALIRFVMSGNDPLEDPIVSFVADVREPNTNLIKGVFGGYARGIFIGQFGDLISLNLEDEGRNLLRLPILSDKTVRLRMISELQQWQTSPLTTGNYYFAWSNCATGLLSLLSSAGFPVSKPFVIIPNQVAIALRNNLLAPLPEIQIPGLRTLLARHLSDRDAMKFTQRALDEWAVSEWTILKSLPTLELQRIYYAISSLKFRARKYKLAELIATRGDTKSVNEAYAVNALPITLYQTCSNCDARAWSDALKQSPYQPQDLFEAGTRNKTTLLYSHFSRPSNYAQTFRFASELLNRVTAQ